MSPLKASSLLCAAKSDNGNKKLDFLDPSTGNLASQSIDVAIEWSWKENVGSWECDWEGIGVSVLNPPHDTVSDAR